MFQKNHTFIIKTGFTSLSLLALLNRHQWRGVLVREHPIGLVGLVSLKAGSETGSGHGRARSAASDLSRWTVKNWKGSMSVYEALMTDILCFYTMMLWLNMVEYFFSLSNMNRAFSFESLNNFSISPTPPDITLFGDSGLWLVNFTLEIIWHSNHPKDLSEVWPLFFGLIPQNFRDGGARQREAGWWNCC